MANEIQNKTFIIKELNDILLAREERQMLRKKFCEGGNVSISLNLNIPGIPKTNEVYSTFFEEICSQLKLWIHANRLSIQEEKFLNNSAGDFYIFTIQHSNFEVVQIKKITESFEENHPLGRFIDVDVTDENGNIVSSGKHKSCFYCEDFPAIDCMRNQRHNLEILRTFQQQKIKKYLNKLFKESISKKVSSLAIRSILYEICLTPKPGLVDFAGNGIHKDMNFNLFLDSTVAISSFFEILFKKGYDFSGEDFSLALPLIRETGLKMEREMFTQTKEVNTQKGIIFLMGISLFSVGFLYQKEKIFNQDLFISTVKKICNDLVKSEFKENPTQVITHGEKCYEKYCIGGVRKEVEDGFPTVFDVALPILERENNTENIALTKTLLAIMSKLDDTNILYRSNMQTLLDLQKLSSKTYHNFTQKKYKEVIDFCFKNKISPGGAADLLSITIFIYLLKTNVLNLPTGRQVTK